MAATSKKRRKKVARLSDQRPPDDEHIRRWLDGRFSLVDVGEIAGVRAETIQQWMDRGHLDIGELGSTGHKRLFSGVETVQVRIIGELSRLSIPPKMWNTVSKYAVESLRFMLHPSPLGKSDVFLYRDGDDWQMCVVYERHPEDASHLPASVVRMDFDRLLRESRDRIDEVVQRQASKAAKDL